MKLSIIIPVYNEEAYLDRCLSSIGEHKGVEVILIDDGSTDNSLGVASKYKILIYENVKNIGVAYTRNYGLLLAVGDYVTFLDADDALAPDGVETLLRVIDAHPDADVIQLNHRRCYEGACKIEGRYSARAGFYGIKNLPPKWAPVWNKIYKREFLDLYNIQFPEGQQFDEDRRFNIECLRYTGGIVFDERVALHKYFDNEASLCHTIDKRKMIGALRGLTEELRTDNTPEINELIRQSLNMHLCSRKYREAFGGDK